MLFVLLPAIVGFAGQKSRFRCETTAGPFTVTLDPTLSPLGVARVKTLVGDHFFDEMLLYRVIGNFLVQFGVAAIPTVQAKYQNNRLADEPNLEPFRKGTLSFAGSGKNSRSCHLFVALNKGLGHAAHETTLGHLDDEGIETFERVVANHKAAGYGDTGSLQSPLVQRGNAAASKYPKLDRIKSCEHLGQGGGRLPGRGRRGRGRSGGPGGADEADNLRHDLR
jgi:cyclophilin family peptidyl-prolyl cis-trans isomerase